MYACRRARACLVVIQTLLSAGRTHQAANKLNNKYALVLALTPGKKCTAVAGGTAAEPAPPNAAATRSTTLVAGLAQPPQPRSRQCIPSPIATKQKMPGPDERSRAGQPKAPPQSPLLRAVLRAPQAVPNRHPTTPPPPPLPSDQARLIPKTVSVGSALIPLYSI